jgi:Icc-related predicted phosphoesterase
MKILFTSDLHGEEVLYQQILDTAREAGVEILILGGDLLPSLRNTGRYEEMIREQQSFIDGFLLAFFRKGLETRFRRIFLIPGNWDPAYPEIFATPLEGLVDLGQKSFWLESGYEFVGYPFVPPTPFRPKDYEKMDDLESSWPPQKSPSYIRSAGPPFILEPIDPHEYLLGIGTIEEDLRKLPAAEDLRKTIYVMHSPPWGTHLDGIQGGHHVGSRAIRNFIASGQPLLSLHGHIHEGPRLSGDYKDRIGKTLCVNPGQMLSKDKGFPDLQGVVFDLENPGKTLIHTGHFQFPSS